jgi:hypothetical protein
MGDDEEDEWFLREGFVIRLGENLPAKGCESLTTGQPKPHAYVCFHMHSPISTYGPDTMALVVNPWRKEGMTEVPCRTITF